MAAVRVWTVVTVLMVAIPLIYQGQNGRLMPNLGRVFFRAAEQTVLSDATLAAVCDLVAAIGELATCAIKTCPMHDVSKDTYDFVIVGGGSSGAVLAARLTEDPSVSVLLLESGPTDKHPLVNVPLGSQFLQGTVRDWRMETNPQENACGEIGCAATGRHAGLKGCCRWPLGRGLGGGSTINYMAYVRGNPGDYNEWQAKGAKGWNYSTALKYFKKAENNGVYRFSPYHGTAGPLHVSDPRLKNPIVSGSGFRV